MRVRILLSLSVVLLSSVGIATAAAKPKPVSPSQHMCLNHDGTYSTKESSSYFRPFYKKQGVLWTCNRYTGGSATSQALTQSCFTNDGGKEASTSDAGFATCWKNAQV